MPTSLRHSIPHNKYKSTVSCFSFQCSWPMHSACTLGLFSLLIPYLFSSCRYRRIWWSNGAWLEGIQPAQGITLFPSTACFCIWLTDGFLCMYCLLWHTSWWKPPHYEWLPGVLVIPAWGCSCILPPVNAAVMAGIKPTALGSATSVGTARLQRIQCCVNFRKAYSSTHTTQAFCCPHF